MATVQDMGQPDAHCVTALSLGTIAGSRVGGQEHRPCIYQVTHDGAVVGREAHDQAFCKLAQGGDLSKDSVWGCVF